MASRNAGGSQSLSRQSSVATSGSVMKSRQLVSWMLLYVIIFLGFFSPWLVPFFLELEFLLTCYFLLLIDIYRRIYILSWLSCPKIYQIPRICWGWRACRLRRWRGWGAGTAGCELLLLYWEWLGRWIANSCTGLWPRVGCLEKTWRSLGSDDDCFLRWKHRGKTLRITKGYGLWDGIYELNGSMFC